MSYGVVYKHDHYIGEIASVCAFRTCEVCPCDGKKCCSTGTTPLRVDSHILEHLGNTAMRKISN